MTALLVVLLQADESYNDGTFWALMFCVLAGFCSILSNLVVYFFFMADVNKPPPVTLASQIRGFARSITPQPPDACAKWKLPASFYVCLFGIQSVYFAPFSFTAYSNKIYAFRFGASPAQASFFSGVMNMLGGILGPLLGPFSDKVGKRALLLALFGIFAVIGFIMLATTTVTPWVATLLFALTYGFGDTVAYPNIRALVGAEKAGLGYGIFSLVGGSIAVSLPIIGGFFMAMDDPAKPEETGIYVCWFFAGASALGALLWAVVHVGRAHPSLSDLWHMYV